MSVFPIFRLPFVAAKAVVNRMDLGDLTALFLCSKKTQEFVKSLRKSVSFASLSIDQKNSLNCLEIIELFREDKSAGNKFLKKYGMKVNIEISNTIGFLLDVEFNKQTSKYGFLFFNVYIECIDKQHQYEGIKRNLEIGGIDVPVVMTKKNEMYMFWDNEQEGFKQIGNYLVENFVSSFNCLFIQQKTSQDYSENLRFVINWMSSKNMNLGHCDVSYFNQRINDEDFKFMLDNVHAWSSYKVNEVETSDNFQQATHFKVNSLELTSANWFTLENLLMTDCEIIELGKSKLTNNDLNEYLKQWMAGKFPKLKKLDVEMQENMNIDIILYGLVGLSQNMSITRENDKVIIMRDDGFVANILINGRRPKIFEVQFCSDR